MSQSFQNNIQAKSCFGANREPLAAGNYIQKKKARATYCNSNSCINKNPGTYENYNLLHTAQQLDKCKLPFDKYDLNRNHIFMELNTAGLCVLRDASNGACATTIDPSLNIYDNYIIDPSGVLFGNSSCGLNKFVKFTGKNSSIEYIVTGNYDISSNIDNKTIITFTGNGTFTLTSGNPQFNILIVGGGGGGGSGFIGSNGGGGGGGGGGGVIQNTTSLVTNTLYTINVGIGGTGANVSSPGTSGTNGVNSSIIGGSLTIGAAGGYGGYINGGASGTIGSTGGTGNLNPGDSGYLGGGGGGAGYGGSGGNGSVNISTTNYGTTYGAGGGGGSGGSGSGIGGIAGNSNAGNGGTRITSINAGNGIANTGGGGGGGSEGNNGDSFVSGGNGGSGVVIISFNVFTFF